MPDQIFADPRLARLYDHFQGARLDLDHYVALVEELGARSVLDVGCGTGTFASLLAGRGFTAIGIDPAPASLDIALTKPNADRVQWLLGDATALPALDVDLAIMTGNVAQVFLTDQDWAATLFGINRVMGRNGRLVFETRDPERRAWEDWNPDRSRTTLDIPDIGPVESWAEVTDVALPLVTFERTYHFTLADQTLTSTSTLRFRDQDELHQTLGAAGFTIDEIRDAPDRPGKEWVIIAELAH